MQCQKFKAKLEKYIDHELPDQKRIEIEEHLSQCAACMKELQVLKEINAFGKMNLFPEPEPGYWKELHQNIMYQIGEEKERPPLLTEVFDRIKNIILPVKPSYRLIGLTATAIMVFFIVRISFFREGKFELPIKIESEDVVKISEPGDGLVAPQNITHMANDIVMEKSVSNARRKSRFDQDSRPDQLYGAKAKLKVEPAMMAPHAQELDKLPIATDEQAGIESETDISLAEAPAPMIQEPIPAKKTMRRMVVEPAVATKKSAQLKQEGFKFMAVSEKPFQPEPDSSFIIFNNIQQKVSKTEKISDQMKIWSDYINTAPQLRFIKKVKYEQALLHYKLAKQVCTPEVISQALSFYMENAELLFTDKDSVEIENQINELNDLLKKSGKK